MSKILKGLTASEYISPDDKDWLDTLDAVPGIKSYIGKTLADFREKFVSINILGSGVSITPESYPDLYAHLSAASKILDVQNAPELSIQWAYNISMETYGSKSPRIAAASGAVDLLTDEELSFLLGHEMGHIMAGHKPYHEFLMALYSPMASCLPDANVWLPLVGRQLLKWYRFSDFTADRAGLLACQDIDVAITTMAKLSGAPKKYYGKLEAKYFLKQAKIFEQNNKGLADNIIQNLSVATATSPWLVVRAAKLYDWYESGEYQKVLDKRA